MTETREDLEARIAQFEAALVQNKENRQQAIADGNREIVGKIHQIEKELSKRIADLRARLNDYSHP